MLTVPFHLLLHVPRSVLQEDLLHDIQSDRSVVPCFVLLTFFQDRCNIFLSSILVEPCPLSMTFPR